MIELPDLFRQYFAPHCPPGTTPDEIAERMRKNNHMKDPAAWRCAFNFFQAHRSFGVDFFAWQIGVPESRFRVAMKHITESV